ncbi:hypothetical protein [Acutalibacter caecimuris]|uniref:hypothetical protein n=1 Tax=Acutalibacter caecimuris TaxID=3093657 RepID=UPI002AC89B15|nr:hypothetical protein [Acutalibacter sp. M00118]
MSHSRQKLDLTGQRYGKLTVLYQAENMGGRTAWRCLCDCGNLVTVRSQGLRSGHTKSCGCMRKGPIYVDGASPDMLWAAKIARKNNTSGVPGVDWLPKKGLWRATICFKGKRHYLGSYRKFEDAVKARKRGEEEFHDRFLREVQRKQKRFAARY